MINIYEYTSYREYLRDFYNFQKTNFKGYTYKAFSEKAGLKSPNYLFLVIKGKRNVTIRNISNFIQGLGLVNSEAKYFENLVKIEQTLDFNEKVEYFEELYNINKRNTPWKLERDQYKILSKWYYYVVREMVLLSDFQRSPRWISEQLNYKISAEEAKDAIETLLELDLLKEEDGKLLQANPSIETSKGMLNLAIQNFHNLMINRSLEALKEQDVKERNFTALTVAVSKEKLRLVNEKINEFKKEINDFLTIDDNQEDVYQLNIQFFKFTK